MIFTMISAYAAVEKARQAQEQAWRRHKAMHAMNHRLTTGIHDIELGAPRSGKCKCCWSVEFRAHSLLSVCAYCRTPA